MNITGNENGYFNVVEFFNSTPTNINTFNSSLCAVQRASNTGGSLLTYRPSDGIPAFSQFTPNSGYIVLAKENFVLSEDQAQPTYLSRTLPGNTSGYFSIFKYNYNQAQNINTFNSSLCAVQRASSTGGSLLTYRPSDGIPAFSQFTPNSGYIILAKEPLTINNPLPPTPTPTITPTPTPTSTPTPTPLPVYALVAVGANNYGQLGTNNNSNLNEFTVLTGDWSSVTVGRGTTFALSANTNKMFCTGLNNCGQLGLGDFNNRNTFTQLTGNWSQVVCGLSYTLAQSANTNRWYGTGFNSGYQLGLGDNIDRNTFTPLTGNWSKIVCTKENAFSFALFLSSMATIAMSAGTNKWFGVGKNSNGLFGLGNTNDLIEFTPLIGEWSDIALGGGHSMALSANTTKLFGAGNNSDGQLGTGFNFSSQVTNWTELTGNWSRASCSTRSTLALSANTNKIFSCGYVFGGSLGLGINTGAVVSLSAIQGEWASFNTDVYSFPFSTSVTLSSGRGELFVFGTAPNGFSYLSPTQLPSLTGNYVSASVGQGGYIIALSAKSPTPILPSVPTSVCFDNEPGYPPPAYTLSLSGFRTDLSTLSPVYSGFTGGTVLPGFPLRGFLKIINNVWSINETVGFDTNIARWVSISTSCSSNLSSPCFGIYKDLDTGETVAVLSEGTCPTPTPTPTTTPTRTPTPTPTPTPAGISFTAFALPSATPLGSVNYAAIVSGGDIALLSRNGSDSTKFLITTDMVSFTAANPINDIEFLNLLSFNQYVSYAYGNNTFVGTSYANTISGYRSVDGINWSLFKLAQNTGNRLLGQPSYNSAVGKFLIPIANFSQEGNISSDGLNWSPVTIPYYKGFANWWLNAAGNGVFVVGDYSTIVDYMKYSSDGVTWSNAMLPVSGRFTVLRFLNNRFILLPSFNHLTGALNNTALSSTDGIYWEPFTVAYNNTWTIQNSAVYSDIEYFNGKYYVSPNYLFTGSGFNYDGVDFVYESSDLKNWTTVTVPTTARLSGGLQVFKNNLYLLIPDSTLSNAVISGAKSN